MKILLLGRNGQLGWELQRALSPLGELIALGSSASDPESGLCGDLADADGLRRTLQQLRPQIIVNAAAYTAVDKAESDAAHAHAVNALGPAVLAQEASRLGAWLVHYSSDYVFDGSGTRPWVEDDTPAPLGVYGASKRDGDLAVAQHPLHLILRTSWVFGARGGNFARTMLRLAKANDSLRVIADQFGAPTSAELLADVSAHALRRALLQPALAGLYHCAAGGETSWHGYATYVLERAHALGWELKARAAQVQAIGTQDYPTPARRPLNSRLDGTRLQQRFDLRLPPWQQGVARMLEEITPPR